MNRHAVRHALFFAVYLAASAASAGAEIVKCVDAAGHVTLTDEPCREGRETVVVPASAGAPPAAAESEAGAATAIVLTTPVTHGLATEHILVSRLPAPAPRRDRWAGKAVPDRALARDVVTLKAARASLLLMDSGRTARLAGLN